MTSPINAPEKPIRLSRNRPTSPRLLRELQTIEAMTRIYCADHHGGKATCDECQALMTYAAKRLAVCVFGEEKPVCAKCQIHCYGKVMREKVRVVMRYAGPRMIWRHPWLALMHVVDKRYVAPPKPSAAARGARPANQPSQTTSVAMPRAEQSLTGDNAAAAGPAPSGAG